MSPHPPLPDGPAGVPSGPKGTSFGRYLPRSSTMLGVLTGTQNISAAVFSVFLGVHIASPLAASLGGITAADRTMLLAREYYLPLEPILVYAPLFVHLISSTSRRLILIYKTKRSPNLTPHLITGWCLPFLLFPHILSHRIYPSSPIPPISSLSPSELSWEYVGWNLNTWPVWSYTSYIALVGLATWHSGVGMMKIISWARRRNPVERTDTPSTVASTTSASPTPPLLPTTSPSSTGSQKPRVISSKRKFGLRGLMLGFLGVIAIGLVRVVRDSTRVSKIMATRYQAIYAR